MLNTDVIIYKIYCLVFYLVRVALNVLQSSYQTRLLEFVIWESDVMGITMELHAHLFGFALKVMYKERTKRNVEGVAPFPSIVTKAVSGPIRKKMQRSATVPPSRLPVDISREI